MTKRQTKFISLFAGIGIALFFYLVNPFVLNEKASIVLSIASLMITWWVTEALPMPVVALFPLILFPLLGIEELKTVAVSYGDPIIFLFMGGFMLGLAIEKWNLHRRIALGIVKITGTSGNRIILGFILATGFISMWISNTATTMMMFPIALSVIHVMKNNIDSKVNFKHFSLALMLSIAYASNFGGIATKIGTPPNSYFAGYYANNYSNIGFMDWITLCMPIAIILLIALYIVLTKLLFRNHIRSGDAARNFINEEYKSLGPLSVAEKRVMIIFITTASLWILTDPINRLQDYVKLSDTIIALLCAAALFICPSGSGKQAENLNGTDENELQGSLLEWSDTKKMAWGILLLFGGGLALAAGLEKQGLIKQLGEWLSDFAGGSFILLLMVTIMSVFISEVMSNIAQVTVFAPVVCSLAAAVGMNPLQLGIAMTLASSCASMMPMGTPPNAIAFASGQIKIKQMMQAGFVMNIVSIILITLFCWFLLPLLIRT
ncbi:MAG TPA: SLC13 family permease [Chitinophagaceae bacterium]|nr:SLC13 family permease [Chitinophagaceae bacterium]